MKKHLQRASKAWKRRKRYKYGEMPDFLLVVLGVPAFLVSSFCWFLVAQHTPDFLDVANRLPLSQWGWKGWLFAAILAWLTIKAWYFTTVALQCNEVLRGRWFR